MANNVTHFAVHADDTERARSFYEQVFGWKFEQYGMPGFYIIKTGDNEDPGIGGALHGRQFAAAGHAVTGFECTVSVDNLDETLDKVQAQKGQIVMPKSHIPGVGTLIKFLDPSGNTVCAMEPEKAS